MEWIESAIDTLYSQSSWYVGSAMTSCYMLYYLFEVVKKPIIATNPKGKFSEYIEKNMPVVKEKFWPTLWCIESRAQTIIASLVRVSFVPVISFKREVLVLKDGGEVCLDTLEPKDGASPNTPTIIVLPGLTGSSQSEYIKGLASTASDLGIRMVVFNQRGIGIRIKTPRTYCAANTEDLVEVVGHIKAKYERSLLGAVGISMGGLILGNYLSSTERSKIPISCAMIISVPWNVHLGTESIETPILNMLLNRHLASSLCEIIRKYNAQQGAKLLIDSFKANEVMRPILESEKYVIDDILKSKTIREFDSKYTVKQFGYKDVTDYYNHATIHDKIDKITIPLLCLSSADDPFQPLDGIPIDTANKMDNVCIIVTSRGGHIGFMEGILPINKEQYMCRVFGQYFKSMLIDSGIDHFSKETNVFT